MTFCVSPKMSTYLLAWAVGEFDFIQAVTKGKIRLTKDEEVLRGDRRKGRGGRR